MNTNEISPKTNFRLNRIKIVSRIVRVLIGILVAVMASGFVICLLASAKWQFWGHDVGSVTISFSPHQTYAVPFDIPWSVVLFGTIRLCLFGFGLILLNRLLSLYERGIFFAAGNVRCIKFLGLVIAGCWLVEAILELMAHQNKTDGTGLICGFLLVFIAWIMDEGRKIQEEQELTV
jgi:hypothetical protein